MMKAATCRRRCASSLRCIARELVLERLQIVLAGAACGSRDAPAWASAAAGCAIGGGEGIEHAHGVVEHRHVALGLLLHRLERIGAPGLDQLLAELVLLPVRISSDISR